MAQGGREIDRLHDQALVLDLPKIDEEQGADMAHHHQDRSQGA